MKQRDSEYYMRFSIMKAPLVFLMRWKEFDNENLYLCAFSPNGISRSTSIVDFVSKQIFQLEILVIMRPQLALHILASVRSGFLMCQSCFEACF